MVFNTEESLVIVSQKKPVIVGFLEVFQKEYAKVSEQNIVLNLLNFENVSSENITSFLELSNTHRESGKSFVIVSENVSYDDVPEEINVVPTLQEARDIIEMEEIERDLGF